MYLHVFCVMCENENETDWLAGLVAAIYTYNNNYSCSPVIN